MNDLAIAIKAHSATLLAPSHGPNTVRHASIAVCREHTDLTSREIATIHNVNHVNPNLACATVERYRGKDPDLDRRYRQLLDHANDLRRRAGYAHANLKRGLTRRRPTSSSATPTSTTQDNREPERATTSLTPPRS